MSILRSNESLAAHKKLYKEMCEVIKNNPAFYWAEQHYSDEIVIRSASYHLPPSFTDFQQPSARDCRGTAFSVNLVTKEVNLVGRSYQKFVNLGEWGGEDKILKERKPVAVFEKIDGSIIIVLNVEGKIVAKSKTLINSFHAIKAQELIDTNPKLQEFILENFKLNRTPIFELVGPKEFKIILSYSNTELIYLSSVCNDTAKVYPSLDNEQDFLEKTGVKKATLYNYSWEEIIKIRETSDAKREGFVVLMDDGNLVKVKVKAYCELHHLKDNIDNLPKLVSLIVNGNIDDVINNFKDNYEVLAQINATQEVLIKLVKEYYEEYLKLRNSYFNYYKQDRKQFAIENKTKPMFHYVIKHISAKDSSAEESLAEESAIEHILKMCKTELSTSKFLNIPSKKIKE